MEAATAHGGCGSDLPPSSGCSSHKCVASAERDKWISPGLQRLQPILGYKYTYIYIYSTTYSRTQWYTVITQTSTCFASLWQKHIMTGCSYAKSSYANLQRVAQMHRLSFKMPWNNTRGAPNFRSMLAILRVKVMSQAIHREGVGSAGSMAGVSARGIRAGRQVEGEQQHGGWSTIASIS